ncbi:tRNA delta(2)-isopentenylpyrophosphate transferase [Elusimicrobium minutum Pei191]|uniref:tRNA dimethylallyltransferase n=1 Tax=Elusimicrobium minutum (strain Pei191) TaxID=445932 RepID=MIAA_ELUMP|nr:tRNA (adenosine(37)-N6)-dimethylallyltransferase MiaA [Elusimicrobium minutum]B2KDR9.1 RecName: Full=tRNA dimethylallyltransferase; AltName: Full=Dimethylallyl diphosphate:tRNA dimethylallyltransferase; Short=DMAPP:tRNA dimethylallyltransferase; Short=DMATase; AltName: Full=Isopentenyl-diphosphate:tRNA isopentenyltransferase; Short=IPP transferase; Short=IPPT; Short=IPTase [Elusimicrobium minutum Pei191]ACC98665.1 tRNA delta(2)-isopentenylpyrophosphate transferase [Elusimicrobium minutum Pei19
MTIIIAGPTAGGKTDLALNLAKLIGGEVVSVDSRQVYKYLTVGTAKPEGEYKNGVYNVDGVNYHLVDFLDLDKTYNTGSFTADASNTAYNINKKGKTAIFAGGTGMYMQSYFGGMDVLPKADQALRAQLADIADKEGKQSLHKMLSEADPESAALIPSGNLHRVMRALEIFKLTGKKASELRTNGFADISQNNFMVYIEWDKEELNKRIEIRTQGMFGGMLKETQDMLAKGYTRNSPGLRSLGYAEVIDFIEGKKTKPEALERIVILTRQYAKRQRTWFARYKNMYKADGSALNAEQILAEYAAWKK